MSKIIEQPRFSCALAAQLTVTAIPRALPIVHSGPGCVTRTFNWGAEQGGFQGEGYGGGGQIACTNSQETEVVFGGENKLRKLVEGALKVLDGDLFVILAGCTSGIIGDDIVAVANEYRRKEINIVGAETSGFTGNNYYGHELVVNSIIEQFTGDVEAQVQKGLVNVFSVVPYQDPFWKGDLEEIKRVLEAIGLTVNILYGTGSAGVSEWKNIANAEFNIVLSPWVGLETARLLQKRYGTPFLHYPILPVGARATSRFLREVGKFAHLDSDKVEAAIKKEEERFYDYFVGFSDFMTELRTNIPGELYAVADSAYTTGTVDFLVNELGFIPKGVFIVDEPPEKEEKNILNIFEEIEPGLSEKTFFESDGGKIQSKLHDLIGTSRKAVILGSTWEEQIAKENNNLLIQTSLPIVNDFIVTRSFTGYNGGLRLVEEIYSYLFRQGKLVRSTQTL